MNEIFKSMSLEQDQLFDIYVTSEGALKSFGVAPEELFEWEEDLCTTTKKHEEYSSEVAMLSVIFYAFLSGMIYQKKFANG